MSTLHGLAWQHVSPGTRLGRRALSGVLHPDALARVMQQAPRRGRGTDGATGALSARMLGMGELLLLSQHVDALSSELTLSPAS